MHIEPLAEVRRARDFPPSFLLLALFRQANYCLSELDHLMDLKLLFSRYPWSFRFNSPKLKGSMHCVPL